MSLRFFRVFLSACSGALFSYLQPAESSLRALRSMGQVGYMHKGALRDTPEARAHSPSQMPLGCPVVSSAPGRSKSIKLQATAPSPTPTRAEHLAGMQIARLCVLARRRAPKRTPHVAGLQISLRFAPSPTPTAPKRSPCASAPLAHAGSCGGTPRRDAGLQTSRPRRQSERNMSPKPSPGLPHQQRLSNVQRALDAAIYMCVGYAAGR